MEECKVLEDIGLTKGEVAAYLYLLTRPQTNVSKIASETKLNRSNLYTILESLTEKNLVTFTIINKIRYYSANKPSYAKDLLDKKIALLNSKKAELNTFISKVGTLMNQFSSDIKVEFYHGKDGIKQVLEAILHLKRGSVVYSFGYQNLFEKYFPYYFKKIKNARVNRGIYFKAIYRKPGKTKQPRRNLTDIRYINLEVLTNVEVALFNDTVALFLISNNPRVIVIKSASIFTHFQNYFTYLWDIIK